jgi:hypothetical protein
MVLQQCSNSNIEMIILDVERDCGRCDLTQVRARENLLESSNACMRLRWFSLPLLDGL